MVDPSAASPSSVALMGDDDEKLFSPSSNSNGPLIPSVSVLLFIPMLSADSSSTIADLNRWYLEIEALRSASPKYKPSSLEVSQL